MTLWTVKAHELRHAQASLLLQIARETSEDTTVLAVRGATAGGDERKLRGIPAIGRGVTGAVAGSVPHAIR